MNCPPTMSRIQYRAAQQPLTPLEQDFASLLADMLVAEIKAERLEREPSTPENEIRH